DAQRLRDAIDRVKAHMLVVTEPPKPIEGELPGQLGIDGSVVGATESTTVVESHRAPMLCPSCNQDMMDTFGGSWTPMTLDFVNGKVLAYGLQCGHCAHIIYV